MKIWFIAVLALLLSSILLANSEDLYIKKRKALVLGNSDYRQEALSNPKKDADLIASILENVGFDVTLEKDIETAHDMKEIINNFFKKLQLDDIAVVYYAGHGVQYKGQNYLMPTQAHAIRGGQLENEAVNLNFLVGGLSNIKLSIIMLDACRNNSYPAYNRSQQSRGLAQLSIPTDGGMIVSYATAPNKVAEDGEGDHSPYALAISKFMKKDMPIETFFRKVGGDVFHTTGSQRPMLKNSFYGIFSFGEMYVKKVEIENSEIVIINGLMYQNKNFTKKYSWQEAKEYCQNLTVKKYTNWRLPTRKELIKLSNIEITTYSNWEGWFQKNKDRRFENTKAEYHFIREEFVENVPKNSWFWSSEAEGSFDAWMFLFDSGYEDWYSKSYNLYTLCVKKY